MLWDGVVMCWSRGEGHSGSGRNCSREHRRRGQDVHRRKDCWFLFLSLLKPPWPFIEKACITHGMLFGCMPVPSMAQLDADSFLQVRGRSTYHPGRVSVQKSTIWSIVMPGQE